MKTYISITLGLLLGMGTLAAQDSVSLDSCHVWAAQHYPTIRQYELVEQTEQYNLQHAACAWLPQASLTAQATWQSDVAAFPEQMQGMLAATGLDLPGIRQDQYKVAIDLYQSLWDGGKSAAQKELHKAQSEQERRSVDVELYQLETRVGNVFFGILLLSDQERQLVALASLLDEQLRQLDVLVANAVALPSDRDVVAVERIAAEQRIDQVRTTMAGYKALLSVLTGRDLTEVPFQRPHFASDGLSLAARASCQPERQLMQAQMDVLAAQEKGVRVGAVPTVGLFAQGWYGYPGLNMFENMMHGDWSWNAIVGVRMQWNISAFYTQNIRMGQLRTAQRQIALKQEAFDFNSRIDSLQENGEVARLQRVLEQDEEMVRLRRSVRQAAESQHQHGTLSTAELLARIIEEHNAVLARTLHETELMKAAYEGCRSQQRRSR